MALFDSRCTLWFRISLHISNFPSVFFLVYADDSLPLLYILPNYLSITIRFRLLG